mgnify:CR=1 FL=1
MTRSSFASSKIRPLVLAAVAAGHAARPPRPGGRAVILAFPGPRVAPPAAIVPDVPSRPPPLTLGQRLLAMLTGALAGLALAALRNLF